MSSERKVRIDVYKRQDGGLRPVTEEEVIQVRNKAAKAVQAVFRQLALSPVTDEQVEAVTYAHGSKDVYKRQI